MKTIKEVKTSDLSMNWAIDLKTKRKISAREVHNNKRLKESNRYVCIGCQELSKNMIMDNEKNKVPTILEHVSHDEYPFFRRGKLQKHYERCRFRSPDSNVISLASMNGMRVDNRTKVLRILTSAKLVRKVGSPLGYSRQAYSKFFTHQAHQKFYYFLSTLLKEYEITTFKNNISAFTVENENGDKVKFADIFGLQDDIVEQVEKNSKKSLSGLAVIIGTVSKITQKGHLLIEFTTSKNINNGNTKPFRLFVHQDYVSKVGDIRLLENQKIACYGFAEKKVLTYETVNQMELFSIEHQIFFFDNPPSCECIGSINDSDDPPAYTLQECESFISRFWGAERLTDQEIRELHIVHNQSKLNYLKAGLIREGAKEENYEEFIKSWNSLILETERAKQQLKQAQFELQNVAKTHQDISAKFMSKFGLNFKSLRALEVDMQRIKKRTHEIERLLNIKENELEQNNGLKRQWEEWYQFLQKQRQVVIKVERHAEKEILLKQMLADFNPFIFRIPLKNPKWNLILGLNTNVINENRLAVKAIVQLYESQNQAWFPADHISQKQFIEYQVSISQLNLSPRDAIKGFYLKLGKAIIERIVLMGWPTSKCQCLKGHGTMKLQFRNAQYWFECWDQKCDEEYQLIWVN
ncbi:hypothetical protein [Paenibacillus chitinolyticus]|uniref:hypothetical protein n=1 Tax=Paenibacillus chitinolyticus TaxID=79263 RepID=UPI00363E5E13